MDTSLSTTADGGNSNGGNEGKERGLKEGLNEDKAEQSERSDDDSSESSSEETNNSTPLNITTAIADSPSRDEPSRDEAVETPTLTRSQAIRARLREREKRLTSLVRGSKEDGNTSFLEKLAKVESNLKQMEEEKSQLKNELNKLQEATGDDEYLKEQMRSIQEGFDKQVKKIQSLDDELVSKNSEIDNLRDELVVKLRKIVELEFDLETHEIHFTSYAAEQFELGEEALAEIRAGSDKKSVASIGSDDQKPVSPRRNLSGSARKLISKLLADLDKLEARYKEEKLLSAAKMEEFRLENSELRTRIQVLETKAENGADGEPSNNVEQMKPNDLSSAEWHNVVYLRKRVETLEAKNTLYRKEMERLHEEFRVSKVEAEEDARAAVTEIDRLQLDNDNMKARIKSLGTRKFKKDKTVEHFTAIEETIKRKFSKMQKLVANQEIKDRQILALKKEVTNLRMTEIGQMSSTASKDLYTEFDSNLLRQKQSSHSTMPSEDRSKDAGYVEELQAELREAQRQLVKKDQELVIERAKAASTAAGLLARITELTGRKAEPSQKQVPSRFYH